MGNVGETVGKTVATVAVKQMTGQITEPAKKEPTADNPFV